MDTNLRALRKQYAALTGKERFALHLAADERRDRDEVRALQESCPRNLYRHMEAGYQSRLVAMFPVVAHIERLVLGCGLVWLVLPENDPGGLAKTLLNEIGAIWQAFSRFCDDQGVTTNQMMAGAASHAYPLTAEVLETLVGVALAVASPEPSKVDEEYQAIKLLWDAVVVGE